MTASFFGQPARESVFQMEAALVFGIAFRNERLPFESG
jgi:hypothetical protein